MTDYSKYDINILFNTLYGRHHTTTETRIFDVMDPDAGGRKGFGVELATYDEVDWDLIDIITGGVDVQTVKILTNLEATAKVKDWVRIWVSSSYGAASTGDEEVHFRRCGDVGVVRLE